MTKELLTPAQYAKNRGVTRQAVFVALKKGKIPFHTTELGKRLIDPVEADKAWRENTRFNSKYHLKSVSEESKFDTLYPPIEDSRKKLEYHKAKLAEIEQSEKEKELISVESVLQEANEAGKIIRDAISRVPDEVVAELRGRVAEDDLRLVHRAIKRRTKENFDEANKLDILGKA
jgi:hypothetical protein